MQIQLKLFYQLEEICRVKDDRVLGYSICGRRLSAVHRLEHTNRRRCLSVQPEADVIRVSVSTVFDDNLALDRGTRQVLEVLKFVDASVSRR
jgi:hypothetical protein